MAMVLAFTRSMRGFRVSNYISGALLKCQHTSSPSQCSSKTQPLP